LKNHYKNFKIPKNLEALDKYLIPNYANLSKNQVCNIIEELFNFAGKYFTYIPPAILEEFKSDLYQNIEFPAYEMNSKNQHIKINFNHKILHSFLKNHLEKLNQTCKTLIQTYNSKKLDKNNADGIDSEFLTFVRKTKEYLLLKHATTDNNNGFKHPELNLLFDSNDLDEISLDSIKSERLFPWTPHSFSAKISRYKRKFNNYKNSLNQIASQNISKVSRENQYYPYRLYDLRHTYLTSLVVNNISPFFLTKIAGWTINSPMPKIYIHITAANVERWIIDTFCHANT